MPCSGASSASTSTRLRASGSSRDSGGPQHRLSASRQRCPPSCDRLHVRVGVGSASVWSCRRGCRACSRPRSTTTEQFRSRRRSCGGGGLLAVLSARSSTWSAADPCSRWSPCVGDADREPPRRLPGGADSPGDVRQPAGPDHPHRQRPVGELRRAAGHQPVRRALGAGQAGRKNAILALPVFTVIGFTAVAREPDPATSLSSSSCATAPDRLDDRQNVGGAPPRSDRAPLSPQQRRSAGRRGDWAGAFASSRSRRHLELPPRLDDRRPPVHPGRAVGPRPYVGATHHARATRHLTRRLQRALGNPSPSRSKGAASYIREATPKGAPARGGCPRQACAGLAAMLPELVSAPTPSCADWPSRWHRLRR